MFAVTAWLCLEVIGDEIMVVGGDFYKRDARSPVGEAADNLTLAVEAGPVSRPAVWGT